jgi:pimeloyl-ACP methyl ester carboxylesterase
MLAYAQPAGPEVRVPTVDRQGTSLFYEVTALTPPWAADAPETIVFHHGVGITSDTWLEWLPALADRYRLVRFDMRGFGRSTIPPPGSAWSLDLLADDVLAVARAAAGGGRFHIVGESLGGTLALYLALRRPAALLTATLCSTSHRGTSIQRVREWRQFIGAHGMAAWSAMMMPLRMDPGQVSGGLYDWFEREQAKSSADSVLDLADLLIGTDLTAELPRIAVPTLLLSPDSSPFVPLDLSLEIHARIPRSELRIYPGVRHAIVASHGRELSLALREFLERRSPPGS